MTSIVHIIEDYTSTVPLLLRHQETRGKLIYLCLLNPLKYSTFNKDQGPTCLMTRVRANL